MVVGPPEAAVYGLQFTVYSWRCRAVEGAAVVGDLLLLVVVVGKN